MNYKIYFLFLIALFPNVLLANNFYWVGGSGNWSEYANHWATTSGGSVFNTNEPTANDDVYFDVNSFTASGQIDTVDDPNAVCRNMTWTGVTDNPQLYSGFTSTLGVFGSLLLSGNESINLNGGLDFESAVPGQTINTKGDTLYFDVDFQGGGEWTLLGDLSVKQGTFYLSSGSVILNSFTVNSDYFYSSGYSAFRKLNMQRSIFIIDYNWNIDSSFILLSDSSVLQVGGTSCTVQSVNQSYDHILITRIGNTPALQFSNAVIQKLEITNALVNIGCNYIQIDSLIDQGKASIYADSININYAFSDETNFNLSQVNYSRVSYLHASQELDLAKKYFIDTLFVDGSLYTALDTGNSNHTIINCTLGGNCFVYNWNTFSILRLSAGGYNVLGSGTSQTITDSLIIPVNPGNYTLIQASMPGTQATLYIEQDPFCSDYLDIGDINAVGNQLYAGVNSIDEGDNSGWTFSSCDITNVKEIHSPMLQCYFQPNIFSDHADFLMPSVDFTTGHYTLEIFNALGQIMQSVSLVNNKTSFQKNNLQNGIYYYKVVKDNLPYSSGRLILM